MLNQLDTFIQSLYPEESQFQYVKTCLQNIQIYNLLSLRRFTVEDLVKSGLSQDQAIKIKESASNQNYGLKPGMMDIGIFSVHNDTPGIRYLVDPVCSYDVNEIQNVINEVNKGRLELDLSRTTVYSNVILRVLDEKQCMSLINYVDNKWDGSENDFKLNLQFEELARLIGDETYKKLSNLMGDDFNEIIIRRCQAVKEGLCINFHVDFSEKTMQIALNNDYDYNGGQLIYATNDGILRIPNRPAGSVTLHNNTIVHGVTKHLEGIRYGLFFLKS